MAAAMPMMEATLSAHIASSPRASAGNITRLPATSLPEGIGTWPASTSVSSASVKAVANKSAHASPVLQFRQLASVAAMPESSVAASLTLLPNSGSSTMPGHVESTGTAGWVDTQRRIEDNVDSKITKVLDEIRGFVAQRIDAFMEKLRSEKLSRERSLLDVQRQLDDLAQRMGPGALVPFEDLARMTSAAASQLEASVDHAQRCCDSACEAVQRDVATFRHDVEEHRAKHFAEIAALCAGQMQTSDSKQQLEKSSEASLAEIRQELDDRCSAMSTALQLFSTQVQRLQGKADSGALSSSAKSDSGSLEEEVLAILDKKEQGMRQDIESLRQQLAASSASLKEQLGQHLDRTVDTAQAALMRSFLEEHKALISSLLEERETRTKEISLLNTRMDRIATSSADGNDQGTGASASEAASTSQGEEAAAQDSSSVQAQVESLRKEVLSLRDKNEQLSQLFVGDGGVATKLVDELRESKRTWNIDTIRLQERLAESLQSLGVVQTQCKELQEWRDNVDLQLSSSAPTEEKVATAGPSGALDELVPKRLLQEMSALRGEVKTSLESAVTAVRLGEQLAGELQAERQARRKDMHVIQGLLGKGATPRVSPPSQTLEVGDTNVSNSALGFQARLLNRNSVPNDSRERLQQLWSEASMAERSHNHDINLEELNAELQRRLIDRVVGVSTVTEPASGSTSVPPAVPSSSGRTSVVSPLWPARDVPRVPLLDLSATSGAHGVREGEAIYAPDQDGIHMDATGIASRRTVQGVTATALWSSQSCHSVGSVALTPGASSTAASGNAHPSQLSSGNFVTPMTVERLATPLASPGTAHSAKRSVSSQRMRPAASPSTGGLRNIQPQPAGLGVALSSGCGTGGPIRQQTLPAQRLPSSTSLNTANAGSGSVSVNIAPSPSSNVHQAGLLQVRGPSPRMDGLTATQPSSTSSPLRSRQMKTSVASAASPDRGSGGSPLRQVSNVGFQGASLSAATGTGSLRNSSPRMIPVARSVSPLRMSRRSGNFS